MKGNPIGKRLQKGTLSFLIPAFALCGGPVAANPQHGVVVRGDAAIAAARAGHLQIHQKTQMAVINWQNFSIGAGEVTQFRQPNQSSTVLNRVVSGNVSQIHGTLKGNGNVYVVNPNGIFVGQNGVIDVAGRAVLSTLDVDDDDFMAGGPDRFYGRSDTGVTNFGTISSSDGDVVLMGGFVDNQGQIGAMNGTVAIGSGGDILLQEGAGAQISVRGASDYTGTGINNSGTIRGASAELKAHGNVYALAINNGGAIRATGADRSSGRVLLRASGGSSNINLGNTSSVVARAGADGGTVEVDAGQGQALLAGRVEARGTRSGGNVSVAANQIVQASSSVVDVSGTQAGGSANLQATGGIAVAGELNASSSLGRGGDVVATGQSVLIQDGALLSADGHSAGGRVRVGGDFQGRDTGLIEADSTRTEAGAKLTANSLGGNAGTVIVWANGDTIFQGEVSASALGGVGNGGLVEVSGKEYLYYDGTARVGTVGGDVGMVLFDPGNVVIGAAGGAVPPLSSPTTDSTISIEAINSTLQDGADVLVVTESGSINIETLGGGGTELGGTQANNRNTSIQWTNSQSSFGAFASGSIIVNNHIRTSGAGSINLLAGWSGRESDAILLFGPDDAWDSYVQSGAFGNTGGSVFIGNSSQTRHVEVGSRFGDTNVAGFDVRVFGSDTASILRYSMIGFHDGGQVFGPRLNKGGNYRLDMIVGAPGGGGAWLLSDGLNNLGHAAAGVGDPIVAIVGQHEVDIDNDGIVDGVHGINSTGVVEDTFIPYANHYNSALTGNWWWQQIEAAGSSFTKDPLGLGGLRPEYGAGVGQHSDVALALPDVEIDGADINVLARGNVVLQGGAGSEQTGASIGHGGSNRSNWGGAGTSIRDIGNETVGNPLFSITTDGNNMNQIIEGGQMERRWSFNGSTADRNSTSIARLAPVYGNINVLAGVNPNAPISVNHETGEVTATVSGTGNVILRGAQNFAGSNNSPTHIGHGGPGQFGEFYGNIRVEAGGSVTIDAGPATRSAAVIGHMTTGHAYWDPTSVADQQLRFFATAGDMDNPNLRRGTLFMDHSAPGAAPPIFDPALDPAAQLRYTLGEALDSGLPVYGYRPDPVGAPNTWVIVNHDPASGNFVPVAGSADGTGLTGQFVNVHNVGGNAALRVIGMNPQLYTQGLSAGAVTHSQGRSSLAPLTLSPVGPIQVEALDGSVITGFHGDVTVKAHSGDINIRAYNTVGTGTSARESRFAAIGHGGRNFDTYEIGSGYRNRFGTPSIPNITAGAVTGNGNVEGREVTNLGYPTGNHMNSGSTSYTNSSTFGRVQVNMTMTGDIDVYAGRHILLAGGNDVYDHARIGHGGDFVADYETSSFILGDIRVVAGGDITLTGGGSEVNLMRAGNVTLRAAASIGHGGGYRSGFFGFFGDIEVDAGGAVSLTNGAYRYSQAQIGHQGSENWGQAGGDFIKFEHYINDGIETTISSVLNNTMAQVTYESTNGGVDAIRDFTAAGAGDLVGAERRTANITVTAGEGVTLTHMQEGIRQPEGRNGGVGDPDNQSTGFLSRDSFAMIGHGGVTSHVINANNSGSNYSAKVGNISVNALGGNVNLENGTGDHRWTRLGHGVGSGNRVDDVTNVGFVRAVRLVGDIDVRATGDIYVNADAADENEREENLGAVLGAPTPSRLNPVAIGHGGPYHNLDVVVLSKGENVNGIVASSNINVAANGSLEVRAGKGVESSYAQVGHGFASDLGDDRAYMQGANVGFSGDINVVVGANLLVRGNDNAWSDQPSTIDGTGRTVTGAFAAIGHGGYQVDAPSSGDITVFVGSDLSIIAQRRTDPGTTVPGASPYSLINQETDAIASGFNFAKVGHFSAENGNRTTSGAPDFNPTRSDEVRDAHQDGNITVVVGRDLLMTGGTTPHIDDQTIFGAFSQIGHGGPSIIGDLEGDITVLVRQNITVTRGSEVGDAGTTLTTRALNNYAMIGHGDRLFDTLGDPSALFNEAGGFRDGNIVVAAGLHGTFTGSLVGHADPDLASPNFPTFGNTQVAVSRLDPFFGGAGLLTATDDAVFSSGGFGAGTRMEFYMPARSNNLMDATTRINEVSDTFEVAPPNFSAPFNPSSGIFAGRADEVYLTPDLWWDQTGRAAAEGITGAGMFPTDALSGQGGAIALVNSPGGFPNLQTLVTGALGDSTPAYRDNNGTSGSGLYTLYYDAIDAVSREFPPPPQPPTQPGFPNIPAPPGGIYDPDFDFFGLLFLETYDSFFREDEFMGEGDLYGLLGLFERDEETQEENGALLFENRLDDLFGDRRDSTSEEEEDEEELRKRRRGIAAGRVGSTFYIFEPGTNRYSSYRVFGNRLTSFYPANYPIP